MGSAELTRASIPSAAGFSDNEERKSAVRMQTQGLIHGCIDRLWVERGASTVVIRIQEPWRWTMNEKKEKPARETWKVTKEAAKPAQGARWFGALRRKPEPSTYQRCLAVHILFSSPRGGLS
jgi:hypothetical protein